jgi:hypothetical protein
MLNGRGWLELRRMAICDDAPKNTASRMLAFMRRDIRQTRPDIVRLISYQDTDVHRGTIYRASGWSVGAHTVVGDKGWNTRQRNVMQSASDKIRWETQLR